MSRDRDNLRFVNARKQLLLFLRKHGRSDRNEMKAEVPYGNYTKLCETLEGEELIVRNKRPGERMEHYELTTPRGHEEANLLNNIKGATTDTRSVHPMTHPRSRAHVRSDSRHVSSNVNEDLANDLEKILQSRADTTEKQLLISARIGQGRFREEVLKKWGRSCAVTGSITVAAIRASHIKPWRVSNNQERLDPENGLPLIASLDALFDSRLISFDDDGTILISPALDDSERALLALKGLRLSKVPSGRTATYLAEHRTGMVK